MRKCDRCGKEANDGSFFEVVAKEYSTENYQNENPVHLDFCPNCWEDYLKRRDAMLLEMARRVSKP